MQTELPSMIVMAEKNASLIIVKATQAVCITEIQ